jgi:S-adenosyl-L-methionine hydrolase (adenosine-forming)
MAQKRQIVTLLTDFGTSDYFVGAMKGAALTIHPDIEFVDLTHEVAPHDIFAAAYTLRCCYNAFPRFTTHVVVVDPGVGSTRRPVFVMTDGYNFIGPDNGVFSFIYELEEVNRVIHLTADHYFRSPVSSTFHGRDVFMPVAAWHAKGIDPRRMGDEIKDYVKLEAPAPRKIAPTMVRGAVIHVDRFGNLVTNFTPALVSAERVAMNGRLRVNGHEVAKIFTHYAEAPAGEPFAYFGSQGLLEIAVARGSAARLLEARRGVEVDFAFTIPG